MITNEAFVLLLGVFLDSFVFGRLSGCRRNGGNFSLPCRS